jgi:anti-sigma factor RsiW
MRCEHLHDSAVYVLGALSPPEREAYERHLVDCADCRAEVAEFADLPGLLGRLDPATAEAILAAEDLADGAPETAPKWAGPTVAPDADVERVNGHAVDPLLPRVLDRAQRTRRTERRRRRWQTAGTALVAACLGVLAVLGVRAAGIGQPASPDFAAMQEVAGAVPVTAELALEAVANGTVVHMQCAYKSEGEAGYGKWTYKLFVVPKTGAAEELESWTAGVGDKYEVTATSHIARADIQRIEIRKADNTPLLVLNA